MDAKIDAAFDARGLGPIIPTQEFVHNAKRSQHARDDIITRVRYITISSICGALAMAGGYLLGKFGDVLELLAKP